MYIVYIKEDKTWVRATILIYISIGYTYNLKISVFFERPLLFEAFCFLNCINMIYYENIFLSSFQLHLMENFYHGCYIFGGLKHASGPTAAAKIWPIEFQNQWAVPIRSLAFLPVDGRPHPVAGSMGYIQGLT